MAPVQEIYIESGDWAQVLPFWQNHLWKGRKSPIRATSSLEFGGGYNLNYHNSKVTFWLAKNNQQQIVGVNSGFKTDEREYRSRGLYVVGEFRRSGIAQRLLNQTLSQAKKEKCTTVWSLPRLSVLPVYQRVGFVPVGESIVDEVEFGPNIFVRMSI